MRVGLGASSGARGRTPADGRPEASINMYELLDFLRRNLSVEEAAGAALQIALATQLIKLNHRPGTKTRQKILYNLYWFIVQLPSPWIMSPSKRHVSMDKEEQPRR
jgi:hypothetical protein